MNAMDTVRLIQDTTERVAHWPETMRGSVLRARPQVVRDKGYTPLEWFTTVEVFRQEGEDPVTAAERLARYMTLHQERWDHTPTLARIQKATLKRQAAPRNA